MAVAGGQSQAGAAYELEQADRFVKQAVAYLALTAAALGSEPQLEALADKLIDGAAVLMTKIHNRKAVA